MFCVRSCSCVSAGEFGALWNVLKSPIKHDWLIYEPFFSMIVSSFDGQGEIRNAQFTLLDEYDGDSGSCF